MNYEIAFGIVMGVAAVLVALGAALKAYSKAPTQNERRSSIFEEGQTGTLFLFDERKMIDCSPNGRTLLASVPHHGDDWFRLIASLSVTFNDVQTHLEKLYETGHFTLTAEDPHGAMLTLTAEIRAGITRIELSNADSNAVQEVVDPTVFRAMNEELIQQREMLAKAPIFAWREAQNGDVIWGNDAYILRALDMLKKGQELSWPLPHLFPPMREIAQDKGDMRQKIVAPDGEESWFDLTIVPDVTARAGGRGYRGYASPCDKAVRAENSLHEFMQTLTKTFAHLPIGLAIFDRQRLLQVFNPALLDLTGLQPDVLLQRPSLYMFLDALRDRNVVPEPKDYRNWRRQILEMERAAADGIYEETWSLSNGQTYKVKGRPHPNGALALMIEDISFEISRSRRYRADLELGQAVIDSMDEGIAVFTSSGSLVMTNTAYADIWGYDPSEQLSQARIEKIAEGWGSQCPSDTLWGEAADFICTVGTRTSWERDTRLLDGRALSCRFVPLAGGATLVGFRHTNETAQSPAPSNLAQRLRSA